MHTIEVLSAILLKQDSQGFLENLYVKNMVKETNINYSNNIFDISADDLNLFST